MLSAEMVSHRLVESVIREELRRSALCATVSLLPDTDIVAFVLWQASTRQARERRSREESNFFMCCK